MFPMALVCGNTFIMKPSEQDPGAAMLLCEMAMDCGIPPGVLNVSHGTKPAVDFLCTDPAIRAISFVGSDHVVRAYSISLKSACYFNCLDIQFTC